MLLGTFSSTKGCCWVLIWPQLFLCFKSNQIKSNQIKSNQIKSLLLSHHHSTSALVSEILMSVLQTVQKNNRQFTYGQTVQKNNKQFTYGQTVQKNNKQFTYGQFNQQMEWFLVTNLILTHILGKCFEIFSKLNDAPWTNSLPFRYVRDENSH